jgi:hypothetical protein
LVVVVVKEVVESRRPRCNPSLVRAEAEICKHAATITQAVEIDGYTKSGDTSVPALIQQRLSVCVRVKHST